MRVSRLVLSVGGRVRLVVVVQCETQRAASPQWAAHGTASGNQAQFTRNESEYLNQGHIEMIQSSKQIVQQSPLKGVYQWFSNRRRARRFWRNSELDQKGRAFYQQFFSDGDIVFDVGANVGHRSRMFHRLGATVVAVEPQLPCIRHLEVVFRRSERFHLVRSALGASVGEAEMLISNESTISTLSAEWVRMVKESGRFATSQWNQRAIVPVETLDNLIERYGTPAFVKIDVEGFEKEVIAGLSRPVGALSLEYTPENIEGTLSCIQQLCDIAPCEFQYSDGETLEFALPDWVDADSIRSVLEQVPLNDFGDVYVRFQQPS